MLMGLKGLFIALGYRRFHIKDPSGKSYAIISIYVAFMALQLNLWVDTFHGDVSNGA